jgi:hypothetical protein
MGSMKSGPKAACVLFMMMSFLTSAMSQTFTRITSGAVVNDGGASRSVNWIDYDNDGYLDLFISNGLEGGQNNFLYHNDHDGTFTKITTGPIVTGHSPSDGASWGDYDNDGDLDAFVVAWYDTNNALYLNNGSGNFSQVTTGQLVNDRGYSENASWGDFDNDGYLDLYVANSGTPSIGAKVNFLYRNNHDGTFTKVTSGEIVTDAMFSRGVSWVDYDNDGDLDMFVTNERGQSNVLYKNMLRETGLPTFTRVTTGSIVSDGGNSFSESWGDADNDGDLDVFIANGWPTGQVNFFYLNNGDGTFARVLNDTLVKSVGFHIGSMWGDYDNDGDLDLYVTTAYGPTASKNILYKNMVMETGTLSFQRVAEGDVVNDLGSSYACAWGDYDRDGDLDLVVAKTLNENENNALYRNDNNNGNHRLDVRCVGTASNRNGLGTKVRIKATINGRPVWQLRVVEGQSGNCAQNLELHFGLGNATAIDSMKIEWPSGRVDWHFNVAADRIVTAQEGAGLTGTKDARGSLPIDLRLFQNYPNPFNPSTTIRFTLSRPSRVSLWVYDVLGKEIALLVDGWSESGEHVVAFAADDLASGTYLYRLQAGTFMESRRMILLH